MFTHNLNPVFLSIGPFNIYYYSLMYIIGFVLAYFIIKKITKFKFPKEKIEIALIYAGVAGIIGARLFYVLAYNLKYYLSNPFEIIATWHGGLSFHGALIGAFIGVYLFCKKYKYNVLEMLDVMSIPFALGLALGRIGNFINGELVGRVTNVPWCVDFGDKLCRHPSQLYESLYSFFIFGVLYFARNKKMKKGMIFATFLLLYSSLRFVTEFFREADPQIGYVFGLTLGQWLNVVMFGVGLILYRSVNS